MNSSNRPPSAYELRQKEYELQIQVAQVLVDAHEWALSLRVDDILRGYVLELCRHVAEVDQYETLNDVQTFPKRVSVPYEVLAPGVWNAIKAYWLAPFRKHWGLTAPLFEPEYNMHLASDVFEGEIYQYVTHTTTKIVAPPGTRRCIMPDRINLNDFRLGT